MSDKFQVIMHITDKPLQFKTAEDFSAYYESQRRQGGNDDVGQPLWKKFAHLPLLKIVDWRGAGGSYEVEFKKELPKETVKNDKGAPLLIIG